MKKLCIMAILLAAVLAFAACAGTPDPEPVPPPTNEIAEVDPEPPAPPEEDPAEDDPAEDEPAEDEPIEPAPPVAIFTELPEDVVYALSTDAYFQAMEIGESGSDERVLVTEYLMGAGTPTFTVIENPRGAGNAILLTNRDETWHALDIVTSAIGLDTSAYSYVITVHGNIAQAGNVNIGGGDSPYATLFSQASGAGDFTVSGTITASTLNNAGERGHLRVSVNNLRDLEIHEIVLQRIELIPGFDVPEREANVVYSLRTDAYFQGRTPGDSGLGAAILGGTQYLVDAGNPIFTVVAHPSGDSSRALRVSNRDEDWHTLDINVGAMDMNLAANSYTIRASGVIVDPPEGSTADLMGTGSPWGRFAEVEVGPDGEFTVEGVINAETMAEHGSTDRVRLAASSEAGESVFYIFELEVIRN